MKKTIPLIAVALVAVLAVWSYFSPHLTLYQMKRAIEQRDADAFSDHVDFPALRENVKGQMMAFVSREMSSPEMQNNPFAGLGQMLGTALVGQMVDTMVSPAGVIAMMSNERRIMHSPSSTSDSVSTSAQTGDGRKLADLSISYKGWDRATVRKSDSSAADGAGFTLRRQGIWSWKLTAMDLPPEAFKASK